MRNGEWGMGEVKECGRLARWRFHNVGGTPTLLERKEPLGDRRFETGGRKWKGLAWSDFIARGEVLKNLRMRSFFTTECTEDTEGEAEAGI